ncbi:NAD(P)/FAD-dependent oxidoreductase [Microbulbifer sp. 2201CG32-9]|uniref:NAD(P)/FAD-dependent oxidoreductase n=1 Tax=Microbulbifer sp. 2201CG32-9 TaxID=3232309 RepID=UPI00345C41AC
MDKVLVIGGGQAAGWACKTLRAEGYDGAITVVAEEAHDFYERPPLSKDALTADAPLPRLFSPEDMAALQLCWKRPARAVAIDRASRQVTLADGERLSYERLLIATGARARLPVADWAQLDRVVTLRSWDDAQVLRRRLATARRVAVIGGGWIGLEVASSARALGLEVAVFERAPGLCGRSVGPEVAEAIAELHRENGVALHLDCGDLHLAQTPSAIHVRAGGSSESFDLVVVGTGVQINLELARDAGLDTDQGVLVDEAGRTSDPHIFAAGDVAQHPQLGICLQSWAFAQNQATVAARALLGQAVGYREPAWLWSDQCGRNIQILGTPVANGRCVVRRETASIVFFYLDADNRLAQMVAFDQPRAIKLGKRWINTGLALDASLLANPDFNLMQLR